MFCMLLKQLHAPVISKNSFEYKFQQMRYFKEVETNQAVEIAGALAMFRRDILYCSSDNFSLLFPNVIFMLSQSHIRHVFIRFHTQMFLVFI